jgi:hypothetical protein
MPNTAALKVLKSMSEGSCLSESVSIKHNATYTNR